MIFAETNSLRKGLSLSVDCELFFRILHLLIRPPRTVFAILAISFAMFAVFPSSAAGTILRTWDGPVTYDANTDMFEFSAPLFDVLFDSGQVIEANGEAVLTVEIDAEGHVTFGTLSIFGSMPGLIPNPSSLLAGLVNSQILFGGGASW